MSREYPFAERFKSVQGEGLYTGTPMAFIRLVGCSVSKKVCTHCDTDYDRMFPEFNGGMYTAEDILAWAGKYQHICITGGEPLDRDLYSLVMNLIKAEKQVHIETSGTKAPDWFLNLDIVPEQLWTCVSPKPGYREDMIRIADEIKVILGGLGDTMEGWPTLEDAVQWAVEGHLVYLQPRNGKSIVDRFNLREAETLVNRYPNLRLSTQAHKWIGVR
jgi:7-carboxy-7-deazaguanine synthase